MSDPSGWLWALLAILGVGGLGLGIAYSSARWSQRRRGSIASRSKTKPYVTIIDKEEIREKRQE